MATAPENSAAVAARRPGRMPAPAGGAGIWWAVLLLIPLAVAVLVFTHRTAHVVGIDFTVYRGGADTLLDRDPLYDYLSPPGLPFTYPPIAAVVFVPLALVPASLALGAWTLLSVLALEAVVWLTLRQLAVPGPAARLRATALFAVLGLALDMVVFNTWVGQVNLLLLLLVFADLLAPTGRFRGVLTGIAAGIKLTPLIFIPYLLLTRRLRAAATATATFAATVAVGFAVTPHDATSYWQDYVFDLDRITQDDQVPFLDASPHGLLVRLHTHDLGAVYLAIAAAVGLLGLAVAVTAGRRGQELTGVLACGITGLLVSPVSWIFHWVWYVPLLVMWTVSAARGNRAGPRLGVAALWLVYLASTWWAIRQLYQEEIPTPVNHFFANLQIGVGLGALVGFAVRLRRPGGRLPARAGDDRA